jgi:hypothetical protein
MDPAAAAAAAAAAAPPPPPGAGGIGAPGAGAGAIPPIPPPAAAAGAAGAPGDPIAALAAVLQPTIAQMGALANQITAALAAIGPPPPPAGGGPLPIPFHLTPMEAIGGIIDYTTKDGKKHHSLVTRPLFSNDDLFDVEPDGLHSFVDGLSDRCVDANLMDETDGICMVPQTLALPFGPPYTDIIRQHGTMNLEYLQQYEATYIHLPTRRAQDTKLLYDLQMNSLTKKGKERIAIWRSQFTITVGGVPYLSGICLFKVIVRESHLDSTATAMSIRTNLINLDEWVKKNTTDITLINSRVRHLLDSLAARGEQTLDLTVNLFKAYEQVNDKEFLSYISSLKNTHQDGRQPLTDNALMNFAANFYKNRLSLNQWEQPTEEMKRIYALEASQAKLRKKSTMTSGKRPPKTQKPPPLAPEKPNWLVHNIRPKATDLNKPKQFSGRDWYYCCKETGGKCDPAQWRCHKPSDCKGFGVGVADHKKRKTPSKQDKGKKKSTAASKVVRATQALATDDDNSADDMSTSS